MFDCAQQASQRHHLDALQPQNIRFAFITHLHSDHTLGYPDLLLTPWVIGRSWPLEVYGPPGIARMTEHIREAFAEDIEIAPGLVYQDEHVHITAIPVPHGDWKHAFGYRIEGPERAIVITGDEAPNDAIIAGCDGCDLLISEGYLQANFDAADAGQRAYLSAFHTSALQLGLLATKARAKAVVLTHQRPRPMALNAAVGPDGERPRSDVTSDGGGGTPARGARGRAAVPRRDRRCSHQRLRSCPSPTTCRRYRCPA